MVASGELISVVVTVYNAGRYLKKCVESVCNQTYKNLEIILVNDGSTDDSGVVCDELARMDERIRVYHKENGGLSTARNYGIEKAIGRYVGFVDDDDYIDREMYEQLYRAIKKYNAQLVECGLNVVYQNQSFSHYEEDYEIVVNKEQYFREFLIEKKIHGSVCCKLIEIDLARRIKFPVGKIYEDARYTFELSKQIDKAVLISGAYYHYYRREGSITTQKFNSNDMAIVELMDEVKEYTLNKYPQYKELLDVRMAFASLFIFNKLVRTEYYKNLPEYSELKNRLVAFKRDILKNPNAPKNLKVALILININASLYKFVLARYGKNKNNE